MAEFINKCDSVGGLDNMFACGYTEKDIDFNAENISELMLYLVIGSAHEAWEKFDMSRDIYYSSIERGIY